MQNLQSGYKFKTRGEKGFSIIELMVSIIIFLIFMSAIYGLLKIGTIQKSSASSQTEVIKNARLSLNTIGRDAVNAGFGYTRVGGYAPENILNLRLGIPPDADSTHDLITAVVGGNNVNTNSLLPSGRTDVISFVFRDINFNAGQPIKFTDAANFGGNGVTATTLAGQAAAVNPFDLFLVSNGTRTAIALTTAVPTGGNTLRFETGASDPLKVNSPYTGAVAVRSKLFACTPTATPPVTDDCMDYTSDRVTAKKVIWVSYSVSSDGTLIKTIYGNNTGNTAANQIQILPIASNVQNFQVKYLLRDGTVSDDPSNGGLNQENFNNVVQIDVTINALVETSENGVKLKNLVEIKSTFSTKNLSYDIG
jgi:type IV pilus assembly protein PilW